MFPKSPIRFQLHNTHTIDDRDQPRSDRPPAQVETRWSVLASTPQSISTSNKFAALAPADVSDDVPET